MSGYFQQLDCSCEGCAARAASFPVFCISLQDQPDRYRACREHLHAVGLCRDVTWYRAQRSAEPFRGCWESHAAVARHCLEQGIHTALILEDDVQFYQDWSRIGSRVERAVTRLPADWRGLYLGHRPRKAHFIGHGLMRSMSLLMHAYIANGPLLSWMSATAPFDARIPFRIAAIDGALEVMQGMYALFPMVARQRVTGQSFHANRLEEAFGAFRTAELLAAVLSPWHRMTWPDPSTVGPYAVDSDDAREARRIVAEGWFDEEAYLAANPDVAGAPTSGLLHFIRHGRVEGRPMMRADIQGRPLE